MKIHISTHSFNDKCEGLLHTYASQGKAKRYEALYCGGINKQIDYNSIDATLEQWKQKSMKILTTYLK